MASLIKLRRGSAQQWIDANSSSPIILAAGEPGLELDTGKVKYGNGIDDWSDLTYSSEPLPDQTGNAGKVLTTDGNGILSWLALAVDDDSSYVTNSSLSTTLSSYLQSVPLASGSTIGGIKLGNGFVLDNDNKVRTTKLVATDQNFRLELLEGGTIRLPNGSEILGSTLKGIYGTGDLNYTGMTIGPNSGNSENTWMYVDAYTAYIATDYNNNQYTWKFKDDGTLEFPAGYIFPNTIGAPGQVLVAGGQGSMNWTTVQGLDLGNYDFISNVLQSDTVVIKSNLNDLGLESNNAVTIKTNESSTTWTFDTDGILNLPNNNGQIGQLAAPYTGLEFRTGSGADWIGISYGEIEDNNTSYFYFDKDGSNYTTANHLAHLQIKNPTHDGHVQWLFDSSGTLTLPQNATIADTGNSVVIVPNAASPLFQLEIKAYDEAPTPDDIHIRANHNDYGLTLGDSNGGSYVSINGDLHNNDIIVSTINKNDEERKDFTFDVLGNFHVPGDVTVSAVGAFKNSNGVRAAYINEVPLDISDLTDNTSLLQTNQTAPTDIHIDGGHALAVFPASLSADGGGSAGRFGPNSIVFNGGGASGSIYDTVLNGGGA